MSRLWRVAWTRAFGLAFGAAAIAAAAMASDPWEGGQNGDDDNSSLNTLSHGITQTHDLDQEGTGDEDTDWMVAQTIARHSYEARVSGANVLFDIVGGCLACAQFERVDNDGTILTEDASPIFFGSYHRTIRWIAASTTNRDFIRVTGGTGAPEGPNHMYTLRFWDTTYSIPRWNNSGGQVTVFLISNLGDLTVTGTIHFYGATSALLLSQPFTIGPNNLFVFNTSTAPALAGFSGHASVVHTAGYGGLAGKAVAVEAATGFSFDTPMTPIPD